MYLDQPAVFWDWLSTTLSFLSFYFVFLLLRVFPWSPFTLLLFRLLSPFASLSFRLPLLPFSSSPPLLCLHIPFASFALSLFSCFATPRLYSVYLSSSYSFASLSLLCLASLPIRFLPPPPFTLFLSICSSFSSLRFLFPVFAHDETLDVTPR